MAQHNQPGWSPPSRAWSVPPPPRGPTGWQYTPGPPQAPSGLFPSRPVRPTYREPHPVRGGALAAGLGSAAAWLLVFGLLANDLRSYAWWTIIAGAVAWLVALALARLGDRGVAAGLAITTALAWSIAATAVAVRWGTVGDWPLW